MKMERNQKTTPKNRHNDYIHLMECRAEEIGAPGEEKEKVIYGKAITYNEKTELFEIDGDKYFEIIDRGALDTADISDVFVKYNHNDGQMVVARTRNGSLKLDNREDGLHVEIRVANTTAGNDLYELVRTGILDKMSFGFTIEEESFNQSERTWTVRKIKKLYEVSAVPNPAYEGTQLYARRAGEVETKRAELENLKSKAIALQIKTKIKI